MPPEPLVLLAHEKSRRGFEERPQWYPQSGVGVEPEWRHDLHLFRLRVELRLCHAMYAARALYLSKSYFLLLNDTSQGCGEVYKKLLQRNLEAPGQTSDYPGQT